MSLPGNVPSGSPYTIPPEPTLSQNPLSIMMSRMSKFAMPSSTPLYHDAIKTVASSDDDSPPARSPNLPSVNNNGRTAEIHKTSENLLFAVFFPLHLVFNRFSHWSSSDLIDRKPKVIVISSICLSCCRHGDESPRQSTYDGTWKRRTHVSPQPFGYESDGIPASLPWYAATDALSQRP